MVAEYSQEYGPGRDPAGRPVTDPDALGRPAAHRRYRVYKVARWTGDPGRTRRTRARRGPATSRAADRPARASLVERVHGRGASLGGAVEVYRLPDPANPGTSVDVPGPDVSGDQMLWSVYNDADPDRHTNHAGHSAPLGVEIQQTTFAFNRQGALGNTVFLEFQIINRSSRRRRTPSTARRCRTCTCRCGRTRTWAARPTTSSAATPRCRWATPTTPRTTTTALRRRAAGGGLRLLPGTARPGGRHLGMTSFNKYINGTDPASPTRPTTTCRARCGRGSAASTRGLGPHALLQPG